ncbi:MAG TPA: ABC transporter permease [Thermoleophilia bacterium]|nr:ABC transporter permease [Thermoleophilia bacterium]
MTGTSLQGEDPRLHGPGLELSEEIIGPGFKDVPAPRAQGARRRSEWVQLLRDALHYRRTQVGLVLFGFIVALAALGPFLAPYSPYEFVVAPFAAPSEVARLGGDNIGRDVLSRVLYGGRSVLILSFLATAVGMIMGVSLGLIAGYGRAAVDDVVMRLLDVLLAFPQIVFVLLLVSVLGPRLWLIVLCVGLSHAPRIARVTRGATLEVRERDFVKAAESLGVSRLKILFGEILPTITSPLLVEFGLRLTYSIGLIAALSFLGFGLQPPSADWGLMINENRIGLVIQPYSVFVPVALIAILTIGVNLITDGIARAMIGIERDTGA